MSSRARDALHAIILTDGLLEHSIFDHTPRTELSPVADCLAPLSTVTETRCAVAQAKPEGESGSRADHIRMRTGELVCAVVQRYRQTGHDGRRRRRGRWDLFAAEGWERDGDGRGSVDVERLDYDELASSMM